MHQNSSRGSRVACVDALARQAPSEKKSLGKTMPDVKSKTQGYRYEGSLAGEFRVLVSSKSRVIVMKSFLN